MRHQHKVLVVAPSWVGDIVMAQSLFKSLHEQIDNLLLSVLVPDWSIPLVSRMPEVTHAIPAPFKHGQLSIYDRIKIARQLHSEQFDQAIILPRSFKSALVPFFARIPLRTGFLGEKRYGLLNDIRQSNFEEPALTVDQFVGLSRPMGDTSKYSSPHPALIANPDAAKQVFQRLGIELSDKPVLAICPGSAFGPAKRWPVAHFADVVRSQLQQDWQVWLLGSKQDAIITAEISGQGLTDVHDLAGLTQLDEVVDLLSAANYVVSNDSGLMHVAAAVDTPIIAIYGSTSPKINPPLSSHATILWENLHCSPCNQRTCPLKHTNCLQQLPASQVISVLTDVGLSLVKAGVRP